MKLTLKSGKNITVTSTSTNKPAPWQPAGNSYNVTLNVNGTVRRFDFWGSYADRQEHKPCDLRGAVACFASDVMAGKNATDALDIMQEFGYDKPEEARRVFKGVKRAEEQANDLGLTWDDLAELADY